MLHSIGSGVLELERKSIGGLTLEGIDQPGDWRWLSDEVGREGGRKVGFGAAVDTWCCVLLRLS